jgi:hypothetical protein
LTAKNGWFVWSDPTQKAPLETIWRRVVSEEVEDEGYSSPNMKHHHHDKLKNNFYAKRWKANAGTPVSLAAT